MGNDEMLKIISDKFSFMIQEHFSKSCEDGSRLSIKILSDRLESNNRMIVHGIGGILFSQQFNQVISQAGTAIGGFINAIDPSKVIMLEFIKTEGKVTCKNSLNGDDIEFHFESENPDGKMRVSEYDMDKHQLRSEEEKTNKINTILDKIGLSFLKDRVSDHEFMFEILNEKQICTPDDDIQWILDNL